MDGAGLGPYSMLLLNNSLVCESVISASCMEAGREAECYAEAVLGARAPAPSTAASLNLVAIVPASVVGGLGALGLIAAGMFLILLWPKRTCRRSFKLHLPPRHGPDTTLVVTDIENSTLGWEGLPLEVMDRCLSLHNELVRKVMRRHHGHESATEGDSFIMAFHSAALAAAFAVELQLELLEIHWPLELLQLPPFAVAHARNPTKELADDARASASLVVTRSSFIDDVSSLLPFGEAPNTPVHPQVAPVTGLQATMLARMQQLLGRPALTSHISLEFSVLEGARSYFQELVKLYTLSTDSCAEEAVDKLQPQQTSVVFNGLRVRVGLHTGVLPCCVVYNKTEKRTQYTGTSLQMAKAVCDAAQGGQVLLSGSTFTQLSAAYSSTLHSTTTLLHMGEWKSAAEGWPDQATALYQVSGGVLEAPVGEVTFLFMNMVGHKMLCAWNPALMAQATSMYESTVSALLPSFNGYLVELSDGLCFASFPSSRDAIGYALLCKDQLMVQDWPEELLAHALCEEIDQFEVRDHDVMTSTSDTLMASSRLLMRGPRIKVGIDCSVTSMRTQISPATGRMTYRGRAINRAARIANKATSGAVLCSEGAWAGYCADPRAEATPVLGCSLGQVPLKGIGPVGIVTCHYAIAATAAPLIAGRGSCRGWQDRSSTHNTAHALTGAVQSSDLRLGLCSSLLFERETATEGGGYLHAAPPHLHRENVRVRAARVSPPDRLHCEEAG
ncbi:MAG: hypothetical protein WDW38_010233 [Sanguina aurantia]